MKTDYQITKVPTKLMKACDIYTRSLLFFLVDEESYWKTKGKLKDGFFHVSTEKMGEMLELNNRKDISCVIDALYRAGIIDVKHEGIGKGKNNKIKYAFKINWDKIIEYDSIQFENLEFFKNIRKLSRNDEITYLSKNNVK